jgi:DNA modification methylase
MEAQKPDTKPRAYADGIPVYCAYDEIVPLGRLRANPKNPNKHPQDQIEKLGKIIRGNGWRNPITVSTRSGLIVKGHGRLLTALLEEFKEVPVEYQNYESEEAELADLTADNRIAELAEMDRQMLADIFADIDTGAIDFELSGYTEEEYGELASALSEAIHNDLEDPDAVIEPPAEPVTKHGDIWILGGRHRVMCGDSTDKSDVGSLMNGEKADITITSPPYGVSKSAKLRDKYVRGKEKRKSFYDEHDDSSDEWRDLLCAAFENMKCFSYAQFVNIQMLAENKVTLVEFLAEQSDRLCDIIVWDKKKAPPQMHKNVLNNQYEFIFVFDEHGTRSIRYGDFHGNESNVIEITPGTNEYADIHRAVFPLALVEKLLEINSNARTVLDVFGGTGTTMIAAESMGKSAYLMELSPQYTDVIVKRYIRATGSDNVKCIRNGEQLSREEIAGIFEIKAESVEGGATD